MSVETVLDKISAHNADVLGCIASSGETIYDNLPDLYDLIDKRDVAEHAANMFAASDALETDHEPFNQLFLEYAEHSIYARRLDDGVLLLLNRPVQRAQFKRMQIGVNLFMKPLRRALEQSDAQPMPRVVAGPADARPSAEMPAPEVDGKDEEPRRRWF